MKVKNINISWLLILPIVLLGFAFKATESSAKIDVKDKTIVVVYTLAGDTHVTVNITDKNAQQVEMIENTDDIQGSYKVTYKLTKAYDAGEYKVNVLFNGAVSCTKSFVINPKPKS